MLDTETKRKIDNARDILVGKVPDPKSQVDQITIALIYKFMDDMDQEAEELGGKTKFFTGEFEKYAWSKIMDSKLGGRERLDLYAEGVTQMSRNKNLPQLFRDIFKDAFLPYRDPETLNLFLKEINEFTYDHSERLGDAFEYLLSVMASQGKAGQFRTPRHIIEFIVDVIDPDKDDTILDPACGTAGFLISAYKHILEKHTKDKLGDKLNPDQRERLMRNFVGYDISPDMVRLSLVNMYLHKFPNPQIYEYDTLTSEERWQDRFDVIMANPPFMTPRGGIRPHKRFAIQANRSELLFVDYIAEHLTPTGRAGIIVPEGIIFQASNAYKSLRKMLVEDGYLWAAVSLPAGVFNPYSGVKTSILFLDKVLAKQTKNILFVKIENDGFDLGAQRRGIEKNDLPEALEVIKEFQQKLKIEREPSKLLTEDGIPIGLEQGGHLLLEQEIYQLVSKEKIAESGDYNLSGERYKEITSAGPQKWPMVGLGEVAEVNAGNSAPQDKNLFENGKWPFCRTSDVGKVHISCDFKEINDRLNESGTRRLKLFSKGTILFPKSGASTFLNHRVMLSIDSYVSSHLATIKANNDMIVDKFLFYLLLFVDARSLTSNQNYPSLKLSEIKRIKIPLPSLETQKQIVEELDGYQKIIDGAKQVVANYKPTIKIESGWEPVELGNLFAETKLGLVKNKSEQSRDYPYPYIKMDNITSDGRLDLSKISFVEATEEELKKYTLRDGDFIYNTRNSPNLVGKSAIFHGEDSKYLYNNNILRIRFQKRADPDFINYYLNTESGKEKIRKLVGGTTSVAAIYQKNFATITVPLPSIETQRCIVKEIKTEKKYLAFVEETEKLFKEKISRIIKGIWIQ